MARPKLEKLNRNIRGMQNTVPLSYKIGSTKLFSVYSACGFQLSKEAQIHLATYIENYLITHEKALRAEVEF